MRRMINLLLGRHSDAPSRHDVDRRVDAALHDLYEVQAELEKIVNEIANDQSNG